jgi:hypothetical protein
MRFQTSVCIAESFVSLQVAVLKVLSGHPGGRASIGDLSSDLAVLNTSGADWRDRLKRMAARAPTIDIFGQSLVIRDAGAWRLTDEGRRLLHVMEAIGPHLAVTTPDPVLVERTGPMTAAVDVHYRAPNIRAIALD